MAPVGAWPSETMPRRPPLTTVSHEPETLARPMDQPRNRDLRLASDRDRVAVVARVPPVPAWLAF
jgi:hypothetical protein